MLHQTSHRWRLGLALSLLTSFLWGILPIGLAVILQKIDVYTLVWFRFLLSFTLLATYLGARGQLPQPKKLGTTSLLLLAIATIGLASNYWLFSQGLALTAPANAEVIIQLSSLLFSFGGLIVFKESYKISQWLGTFLLICGLILFFHEQLANLISSHGQYIYGSGLVALGALSWVFYALAQKQLLLSLTSPHIMLIIYLGCALIFTPMSKIEQIFTLDTFHISALIFCALNTLIAYGSFAESLEHWAASRVSSIIALAPIFTIASAWLVSKVAPNAIPMENLTFTAIFGALLVVSGSMAIALSK